MFKSYFLNTINRNPTVFYKIFPSFFIPAEEFPFGLHSAYHCYKFRFYATTPENIRKHRNNMLSFAKERVGRCNV